LTQTKYRWNKKYIKTKTEASTFTVSTSVLLTFERSRSRSIGIKYDVCTLTDPLSIKLISQILICAVRSLLQDHHFNCAFLRKDDAALVIPHLTLS
jgi:hypothetical protein